MQHEWDEVEAEIAELAAHLDAATHRLLTAIRKYDDGGQWHRAGCVSCAHWLSWRVGWDLRTARDKLRVAKKLAELPLLDECLKEGELSYSKVRAVTRVTDAEHEAQWVHYAKYMPAAQLDKLCRRVAAVNQGPHADALLVASRHVARRPMDNGMVKLDAVLTADEAELVWTALAAMRGSAEPSAAAPRQRGGEAQADALVAMAETVVRGTAAQRAPVEMIVTVPAAALGRSTLGSAEPEPAQLAPAGPAGSAGSAGSAEPSPSRPQLPMLADGTVISADTARRLGCDAGLVTAVVDEQGQPLNIGRRTRVIPTAIKRALILRDGCCRFPGCTNTQFVDGHHIEHWADGGETSLHNLVLLCNRHHRLLHEGGFTLRRETGELRFFDGRGRRITHGHAMPAQWKPRLGAAALATQNVALAISSSTNAPLWDGAPVDYATCASFVVTR